METTLTNPASETTRPERCLSRVHAVQHRWLRLHRLQAVSLLAAWLAVTAAVLVGADYLLRGDHPVRWFFLLGFVTGGIWFLLRYGVPLWTRLTRDEAAILIERTHPGLHGRLITAVQLEGREDPGTSRGLYRQVCRSAEDNASSIDPALTVPGKGILQASGFAWLLVGVLLLVAGLGPGIAAIGLQRLLMPWSETRWPDRSQIRLAGNPAGEGIRIVRGGTLSLHGEIGGLIPAAGVLHVVKESGARERARFEIAPDGAFEIRYRPVNTGMTVTLQAGDAVSPAIPIIMVPPPEITSIQVRLEYPEFTGLEPVTREDGNLQAVLGTRAFLSVSASKDLDRAMLVWDSGPAKPLGLENPRTAAGVFEVARTDSYRVFLTDQSGFPSEDPVVYHVEMVDNLLPRIENVRPGDKKVAPLAVVPISAEVTDDFGVSEILLHWRVGESETQVLPLPSGRPEKQRKVEHAWSLSTLGVTPGDVVTWWLEARDLGAHLEEGPWPVSRTHRLEVLSEPDLARLLNDQIEQVLDQLASLESIQGESADAVDRLVGNLENTDTGSVSQKTQAEKWRQDRLARTASRLASRLTEIAEDYSISRLGQEERVERLSQTGRRLAEIAGEDMPRIVLHLDEAMARLRE